MKVAAAYQKFHSIHQIFKGYKELDQINMYNFALAPFSGCRNPKLICPRCGLPNSRMGTSLLKPPIHLKACGN